MPALVLLPFRAAHAAPPANDVIDDATVIPDLPFMDQVDTTEATPEPDDANLDCWEALNSVWYSFSPTTDVNVRVDTFGSDYDTSLCVYVGTPGPSTRIASNDDSGGLQSLVEFEALEGSTYFVLAGSTFGGGGDLTVHAEMGPPLVHVDVDGSGSVDPKTGQASVWGTVSCSPPMYIEVSALLHQKKSSGLFTTVTEWCEGEMDWTALVQPDGDVFKSGPAVLLGEVCGGDDLDWCIEFEQAVMLEKPKKPKK